MSWMDEDNNGDSGGPFYGSVVDDEAYYAPDDQQQSVATVSGDSQYDLPNTYGYDGGSGYGQNNLGSWGPSQEADDSLYNYKSDYPAQGYDNLPGLENPNFLQQLFGGGGQSAAQGPGGGTSSFLSQLFGAGGKFLAAGVEGAQNKKKQQAYNNIANDSRLDPFGSERPFYQQQARQAVTDPYASPIVRMQTDELLRQANIGGAAHGRTRIQNLSPALLAEQAKVAQSYQEQMARQGGYQHGPNSNAISAALMGGANAGINGYASPLASALNYTSQYSNNNDQLVSALKTLIANGK